LLDSLLQEIKCPGMDRRLLSEDLLLAWDLARDRWGCGDLLRWAEGCHLEEDLLARP